MEPTKSCHQHKKMFEGSRIRAFDCYRPRWPRMTLNGVIALILRYFAVFDSFAGRLCHSGWRETHRPNVCKILSSSSSLPVLAKTNAPCSVVSLRLLSILSKYDKPKPIFPFIAFCVQAWNTWATVVSFMPSFSAGNHRHRIQTTLDIVSRWSQAEPEDNL